MEDRTLYLALLTMFMTSALGVVIYCGMFSYSFKRRKLFVLRLILSLIFMGSITNAMAYGLYFGFTHGVETSLRNIELIRMASNVLSLLLGVGVLFVCFEEKPSVILFATIMGYACNGLGTNFYEMLIKVINRESIFMMVYNDYDPLSQALFFVVHAIVFFVLFLTCARAFAKTIKSMDKKVEQSIIWMFAFFTFIMTGIQGSNLFNTAYNGSAIDAVSYTFNGIVALIYIIIIFSLRFILVWAHTTQEKEAEKAFYDSYKEKVELQEQNMELINLKCHDMKHQLRSMLEGQNLDSEFIEETQKAISIFDAQVKTGNDTLDTLLTQKSLLCDSQKIQLTIMLNGEALAFMSAQEINSFFGNAIDNAVEYLMSVDEDKRFIRISSAQNGSIFTIRVENYCETALKFRSNGLPETTKEDNGYHGFGTKSIKSIAQKYDGDASFERKDDLFIVTAIFMLQ
ncbi:MAG: sensor histidine kinase [Clostridia bacterium]|nr:sensor histidine kinase [Clostridia bacterium]